MKRQRLYRIDEYHDYRRIRPEIIILAVIILFIGLATAYITLDLRKNKTVVDNSQNKPVPGEVLPARNEYKTVKYEGISFEIPKSWKKTGIASYAGVKFEKSVQYIGTTGDDAGRLIEIFVDRLPNVAVTRVFEVQVVAGGGRVDALSISPQCRSFTTTGQEENPAGTPYPSKWNNIKFTCRTSEAANVMVALDQDKDMGIKIGPRKKSSDFLIVYTDHGANSDSSLFEEMLESISLN